MISHLFLQSSTKAKFLVFVMHGYGADMHDLEPIAKYCQQARDDLEICVLNAPYELPGELPHTTSTQRMWFNLDVDTDFLNESRNAILLVESYINDILAKKNMQWSDVILVGFSQGGGIAFNLGIKHNVRAIISYSGFYVFDEDLKTSNISTKVLMTHGRLDQVCPMEILEFMVEKYAKSNNLKSGGNADCAGNGGVDIGDSAKNKLDISVYIDNRAVHQITQPILDESLSFLKSL